MKRRWFLGIDDTDGYSGGCTTYTMSRIIDALIDEDCEIINYPKLIRLNPNVPFKTRGNGALSIEFRTVRSREDIVNIIKEIIVKDTEGRIEEEQAQPCAILISEIQGNELYWNALQRIIDYTDLIDQFQDFSILGEPTRALVGSVASIISDLTYDKTYELLAYRFPENWGKKRKIHNLEKTLSENPASTFSSFDFKQNRELIAPSGPDPVFLGIRGENPSELVEFIRLLDTGEDLESYTIFETNQGTGVHILAPNSKITPYSVISCECTVLHTPKILRGGHIEVEIEIGNVAYKLMCFEPTKQLTKATRLLQSGDQIFIHAATKSDGMTLSLEEFMVIDLVPRYKERAPQCRCGQRMISAGFLKGYKCKKCTYRSWHSEKKEQKTDLTLGQIYRASISAQRHLTRPASRELIRNRDTRPLNGFRGRFDSAES